ncbi:MAG: peptidase C39 family protein [Gammaproteobacteria bacterium]|nr:peptidase C39 family protein [Gammaproteobacteria bacterium]
MTLHIRHGDVSDIPALDQLERACFHGDRISRRQLHYLVKKGNAAVLVAEEDGRLVGDVVLLFSRGTSVARLYSIAVADHMRGRSVGRALVTAAEKETWARPRAYLRLEVRKDNTAAIRLYESLGYRRLGEWPGYYEDHMDAWRFEKSLSPHLHPDLPAVPFYRQTLEFTCGPAALMMAMKHLRPETGLSRHLELRLWREATTIFMTSGHGGCGPFGLALAAARRGFGAQVHVSGDGVHFIASVRDPEKKEVIRLVQEDMQLELEDLGVPITTGALTVEDMEHRFHAGGIPIVLISSWAIYQERMPHWVLVTGFDSNFVYVHDPYVDEEEGETLMDSINMPIGRAQFGRMARYGRVGLQAVVTLYAGSAAEAVV